MKDMEVKKDEITERKCNRKFKMGENIFLSNGDITLILRMKTGKDDYIRKMVTVSIVNREYELFSNGLKT